MYFEQTNTRKVSWKTKQTKEENATGQTRQTDGEKSKMLLGAGWGKRRGQSAPDSQYRNMRKKKKKWKKNLDDWRSGNWTQPSKNFCPLPDPGDFPNFPWSSPTPDHSLGGFIVGRVLCDNKRKLGCVCDSDWDAGGSLTPASSFEPKLRQKSRTEATTMKPCDHMTQRERGRASKRDGLPDGYLASLTFQKVEKNVVRNLKSWTFFLLLFFLM